MTATPPDDSLETPDSVEDALSADTERQLISPPYVAEPPVSCGAPDGSDLGDQLDADTQRQLIVPRVGPPAESPPARGSRLPLLSVATDVAPGEVLPVAWAAPARFTSLDVRYLRYELTVQLIWDVVWTVAAMGFAGWLRTRHGWPGWLCSGGVATFVTFLAWYTVWYPPRSFAQLRYRVDNRVFEMERGVIFRRTTLIPVGRIQHVDLERGPVERALGLSSLVLHTAGSDSSVVRLPGLAEGDARPLRDVLVSLGGDDAV